MVRYRFIEFEILHGSLSSSADLCQDNGRKGCQKWWKASVKDQVSPFPSQQTMGLFVIEKFFLYFNER